VNGVTDALSKAFLHPDFKSVRWAGVLGSVARGTMHERSDVDLVVPVSPRNRSDPPPPPDTQLLEEALSRTLGRPVDVVYFEEEQTALRGYIQLEALLTSRRCTFETIECALRWLAFGNYAKTVLGKGIF
jgi:predicted nucleotidyltransferase